MTLKERNIVTHMDCQSRSESREISPLHGRRGKVCDTGQQNCMASPVKSKDVLDEIQPSLEISKTSNYVLLSD